LAEIVRQLKTFSARRINEKRSTPGIPVWQRNYYERVIRDDDELHLVREYITNNPANWQTDDNYAEAP
jgi:REP element-mobilizing transposase RayT